jgi:hypothetical protein
VVVLEFELKVLYPLSGILLPPLLFGFSYFLGRVFFLSFFLSFFFFFFGSEASLRP